MNLVAPVTSTAATPARPARAAAAALLGSGALLGLSTNLARVAGNHGVAPLPYLAGSLAGAAMLLMLFAAARGHSPRLNRRTLEYFIVSATLSVAASNLIVFHAVKHVGVSFVALSFALPPLLTYCGALLFGMERYCHRRAAGVLLAMAGTAVLVTGQWLLPGANRVWIALALLVPVVIAAGNLYRTHRWPPGASPEALAPGMLLAAALVLAVPAVLLTDPSSAPAVSAASGARTVLLIGVQAVVFAGQSLLLFVLQKLAGPVFLSLIGSVGAVVGVPVAMVLLDEPALPALLPGGALIAAGVLGMVLSTNRMAR